MTMTIATNLANSQKVVFLREKSKLWWKKFGHGRISIKKIAEVEKQFVYIYVSHLAAAEN